MQINRRMNTRFLPIAALTVAVGLAGCKKNDTERDTFEADGVPAANPSPSQAPMPIDTIAPDTAVRPDPTKQQTDTLAPNRVVATDSSR